MGLSKLTRGSAADKMAMLFEGVFPPRLSAPDLALTATHTHPWHTWRSV